MKIIFNTVIDLETLQKMEALSPYILIRAERRNDYENHI
jgi:hypothetical protein